MEKNKNKNKKSNFAIAEISKGLGVASFAALVGVLGHVFVTKDAFSSYRTEASIRIAKLEERDKFYKETLIKIERAQTEIRENQMLILSKLK